MAIIFDEKERIFKMDTKNTTYLFAVTKEGYLGHVYYGRKLKYAGGGYLLRTEEHPYTPSVLAREKNSKRKTIAF